jgi:hypothetical protein
VSPRHRSCAHHPKYTYLFIYLQHLVAGGGGFFMTLCAVQILVAVCALLAFERVSK